MVKLVIFDLDGTLVDSAPDIMNAANQTLVDYGFGHLPFEVIKEHIGEGFTSFLRHVAGERATDTEFLKEIFGKFQFFYDQQLVKHTRFYAGFEKFLADYMTVPGRKVGVVSNKPEYQCRIILKGLGIGDEQLVQIYGGDTFEVKKPHPKPLFEMMRLAGVAPHETVMIGDSKADLEAAKAAGTHFIAVSFGYNSREKLAGLGAEKFIDHFDELISHIKILTDLKDVRTAAPAFTGQAE